MPKKFCLTFLLVLCALFIHAQQKPSIPKTFKFGKVDLQEFETKVAGADSAARGVKLFDIGKGWFEFSPKTGGFVFVFERHIRYKVFNKAGYDLADFDVELYRGAGGSAENLSFMEAGTYNLENGKIVVSKISKDAKFSEKHDQNWTVKKFTLPNVKEGSIVEYKYKIVSDFIFNLRDWYFQGSLPILYSEYSVKIPEYFRYKVTPRGYFPLEQVRQEDVNENYYIPSNQGKAETLQAKALALKYIAENVPAIKAERFITTVEDYVAKIEFELGSTQFPGGTYKDYSSNWPKLVSELMEEQNFGKFFSRNGYSKSLIPEIVKMETNPELQMQLIFDYVKANLKWNDRYSKYSTVNQVKAVFEKKSGNSADINLSLLSLLREAKINASPVLISTRENGYHPGYPLVSKFNNVIIAVELEGKTILLDAADRYLSQNLISYQNLNQQGLKINVTEKDGSWIPLEVTATSRNNTYYNLILNEENKLTGNLFLSYNNYTGLSERNKYASATNETEFIKDYKRDKPGLEINSFKIENLDKPSELLIQSMEVVIEDKVEEAGDMIMLSPLLFEQTKENPFKLDERNFPVDFAYPFEENYRVLIEFPKNYKLEKLPANGKIQLPNNEGSFTYVFSTEGNKIALNSRIVIAKSIFPAEGYHDLKELYRLIIEKQAQQIVFKKI
jgi:hypothetical protein